MSRRKRKAPVKPCPMCGSHRTQELPGRVVWECMKCGYAFHRNEQSECRAP